MNMLSKLKYKLFGIHPGVTVTETVVSSAATEIDTYEDTLWEEVKSNITIQKITLYNGKCDYYVKSSNSDYHIQPRTFDDLESAKKYCDEMREIIFTKELIRHCETIKTVEVIDY